MLLLLSRLKEEAIIGVRAFDLKQSAENAKAEMAVFKTQLNLCNMLLQLPVVVSEVKEQLEKSEKASLKFRNSQERGEI